MEFRTIKGFKDILPHEVGNWQFLESEARKVFHAFGYREIRTPILEWTELFSRSIGQETDIVSKEMYTLTDSRGRGMTLRPEATASVVRAYIQEGLYRKNPLQKLYCIGPMFRHERPQKGRFRQFHQLDAEFFGDPGPESDAETIIMAMRLFECLGLEGLVLNLNSLGCPGCRPGFREKLTAYLAERSDALCGDCRRRSETNPLRVFDCKVPGCGEVMAEAPAITGSLCGECRDHFAAVSACLERAGVPFVLNPRLVRGLDYYNRTTFEVQTDRLGAQNAVAGGGRYDGLVKLLGGPDHPAIGFAVGVERVIALLEEKGARATPRPDLFVAAIGPAARDAAFGWVMDLRALGLWVEMGYGTGGLKSRMKRADRLGARKVLIVGDDELASGKAVLRDMGTGDQETVPLSDIVNHFKGAF